MDFADGLGFKDKVRISESQSVSRWAAAAPEIKGEQRKGERERDLKSNGREKGFVAHRPTVGSAA